MPMDDLAKVPEWLGTAVLGAIIAAVGYVAKLFLDGWGKLRAKARSRRAQLVELHSLLRAGKAAFEVQCRHRDQLMELISTREPGLFDLPGGFERWFTAAYPTMTAEEKEIHTIIRAITVNTLRPLNERLLEWLRKDSYFKAGTWGSGLHVQVARRLADLEAHLLLWNAKYAVWIPDHPAHALVYLADEEEHGVGFPRGIEAEVEQLLRERW